MLITFLCLSFSVEVCTLRQFSQNDSLSFIAIEVQNLSHSWTTKLSRLHETIKCCSRTSQILNFQKDFDSGPSLGKFLNLMPPMFAIVLKFPLVVKELLFGSLDDLAFWISTQLIISASSICLNVLFYFYF